MVQRKLRAVQQRPQHVAEPFDPVAVGVLRELGNLKGPPSAEEARRLFVPTG
jgi:hypothetical protein